MGGGGGGESGVKCTRDELCRGEYHCNTKVKIKGQALLLIIPAGALGGKRDTTLVKMLKKVPFSLTYHLSKTPFSLTLWENITPFSINSQTH